MTRLVLLRHIRRKPTSTDSLSFRTSFGRFNLEVTAKGFQPYSADVYMPATGCAAQDGNAEATVIKHLLSGS